MQTFDHLTFLELEWGGSLSYRREVRYGLRSLLVDVPTARPVIYTDAPDAYGAEAAAARIIDISDDLPGFTNGWAYHFRAKICVLLHALRHFGGACVLMDSDSFVRPGFAAALSEALRHGAVMNFLTFHNPFPHFAGFTAELPHAGPYRYDPLNAPVFNSGLIAVTEAHIPALEDALVLMDALRPLTAHLRKDQEQFAVGEALRLHGVTISTNRTEFNHYCNTWARKYVRWRLRRIPGFERAPIVPAAPHITIRKSISRAYKAGALLRLLPLEL